MIHRVYSKRQKKHVWAYDLTFGGRRIRDSGFLTKAAVEAAVSAIRVRVQQEKYGLAPKLRKRVRLAELIDARARQIGTALSSQRHTIRILRRWAAKLPANLFVDEVTKADLHDHAMRRLEDGIKPQTAKQEVAHIHACLAAGCDLFAALKDWQPPRTPKLSVPRSGRERVITLDEVVAIFQVMRRPQDESEHTNSFVARMDIADILQTALQTTARRGEVLRLRWTDVNWNWKTVRITSSKTSSIKTVPAPETLLEMLRRRRAAQIEASDWIFPGRDGKDCRHRLELNVLKLACERAGVPYGRFRAGGIVFHDSRHTAVSAQLADGADLATAQANSGHSTRQMLMLYSHATARSRREAVRSLEPFGVNLASGQESVGSDESVGSEESRRAKS